MDLHFLFDAVVNTFQGLETQPQTPPLTPEHCSLKDMIGIRAEAGL